MQAVFCQLSAVVPLTGGGGPLPRACVCRLVALLKERHERRVRIDVWVVGVPVIAMDDRSDRTRLRANHPPPGRPIGIAKLPTGPVGQKSMEKVTAACGPAGVSLRDAGFPLPHGRGDGLHQAVPALDQRRLPRAAAARRRRSPSASRSMGFAPEWTKDLERWAVASSCSGEDGGPFSARSRSQTSNCRKGQTVALPDGSLFIAAAINTAVLKDRDDVLHEFLDIVGRSWRLERVAVDSAVVPQVD